MILNCTVATSFTVRVPVKLSLMLIDTDLKEKVEVNLFVFVKHVFLIKCNKHNLVLL